MRLQGAARSRPTRDGDVDLEALQAAVGPQTAGIMLTNPSTLGVFERRIEEIAKIVHEAGGLLYYDGANLNAILGKVRRATWASTSCTSTCTRPSPRRTAVAARAPARWA